MITQYILNHTHPPILPAHRSHCSGSTPLIALMRARRRAWQRRRRSGGGLQPWETVLKTINPALSLGSSFRLPLPSAIPLARGSRRSSRRALGAGNRRNRGKRFLPLSRPSRFPIGSPPPARLHRHPSHSLSTPSWPPRLCARHHRLRRKAHRPFRWPESLTIHPGWLAGSGQSGIVV